MKCFIMPVITGATGIVTKGLQNIWKQYYESPQQTVSKNTAILMTSHVIRNVLQS